MSESRGSRYDPKPTIIPQLWYFFCLTCPFPGEHHLCSNNKSIFVSLKMDIKIKHKIFARKTVILTALFLFSVTMFEACTGNNDPPKSVGITFVSDPAALLSKAEKNHVTQLSSALLRDMDIHIMTVVLKQSPEDINNKAVKLFQKYGVGRTTNGTWGKQTTNICLDLKRSFSTRTASHIKNNLENTAAL